MDVPKYDKLGRVCASVYEKMEKDLYAQTFLLSVYKVLDFYYILRRDEN